MLYGQWVRFGCINTMDNPEVCLSISGGKNKLRIHDDASSSTGSSSRISANDMQMILDRLMFRQNRISTSRTYMSIWRQFNKFLISLNVRPNEWEERTSLFLAYMIDKGMQSGTVRSYVSAIKKILVNDGYKWNDNKVLLSSLTKACKLINDHVHTRFPIHCSLLELILFEIGRIYDTQYYLECLYKAIFAIGYYGLLRVGELTEGPHVVKACNVHLGTNKDKLLLVLYSSKTHDEGSQPQKVKITANYAERSGKYFERNFCPFKLMEHYISVRGSYESLEENFFIFSDRSPVTAETARKLLKKIIRVLGLNPDFYDMHSLRIGRASDVIRYGLLKRLKEWADGDPM